MKRHLHQNNQRITPTSLNRTSTLIERSIFDDLIRRVVVSASSGQRLADGKSAFFPLADCRVDYVSGNRQTGCTFKINAGLGFKNRSTAQTDPDLATFEPVYVSADTTFVTANSDPANPRIDCVFAKPATTDADSVSVDVIDPVTKNITSQSLAQTKRWGFTYAVVTGTPAPAPSEPAPPVGYTVDDKIASITIAPGSGTFTPSGNLIDRRTLFSADPNLVPAVTSLLASQIVVSPTVNGQANAQDALTDLNARIATVAPAGQVVTSVEWVSTAQAKLKRDVGGAIRVEIDGVVWTKSDTDLTFDTAAHFTAPEVPVASSFLYGYVEIQGGVMVPHLTHAAPNTAAGSKVGYHPTNTTWRHVLTLLLEASANVVRFISSAHGVYLLERSLLGVSANGPGMTAPTTYTALTFSVAPPATARELFVESDVKGEQCDMFLGTDALVGVTVAGNDSHHHHKGLQQAGQGWLETTYSSWIPLVGSRRVCFGYNTAPTLVSPGCGVGYKGWKE